MKRQPRPTARKRTSKAQGGLKGFTDARKTKVDLLKDVQTHVVAQGVKNAGKGREDHKIHVSELIKDTACPRYMYYKVSKAERSDPAKPAYHLLEMIWAAGHQEHAKWQKWLEEMGDLWGSWQCRNCGWFWKNCDQPSECPDCGGVPEYREVLLEEDTYSLVGHADGAVPRLETFVEVKSFAVGSVRIDSPGLVKDHTHKIDGKTIIDHEGLWAAVKRPLKSHLLQGQMYLWMAMRMGLPYETITFIYENKTTQKTKAFPIKYSERLIRPYLDILESVQDAVARGVAPKRPALFAKESKPCNECPFKTMCWESSDEDAEAGAVPAGRPGAGGEETGRGAAVRPASTPATADSGGAGGHHRSRRSRTARADDAADTVGRAPRRATRNGGGRRAVGRRSGGEEQGAGFARRKR